MTHLDPDTSATDRTRTHRRAVLSVAVVMALAILLTAWNTAPSTDVPAGAETLTAKNEFTMPDLAGERAGAAEEIVESQADGLHGPEGLDDVDVVDYSPLANRYASDDWVVVATSPKPGQRVAQGTKVRLFALKSAEIAWFRKHETMPKVDAGAPVEDVVAEDFEEVAELLLFRYPKGSKDGYPAGSETRTEKEPGVAFDPRVEPSAERRLREGMPQASEYSTLVRRTAPEQGVKVRLGQLLVVVVEDEPQEPVPDTSGSGSGGYYYDNGGDDDDDFNVPGWLCPTRFC